ncbi:MAG: 50S ribosomal protein L24e [Candidatus Thermoplasmatota archaeon]|jgi:large subunit ribosomal protein L24e|nr:50S ribosomal protein L24e [Candidatus Thermoplasmatota archaeon]
MITKNCTFCGKTIEPGTGIIYVRKDGNILNFCSNKCKTNMIVLKRVQRRVKWTGEYHTMKEIRKQAVKH